MAVSPAMEAALALARTPSLVHAMRREPLPPGVALLLKIVAEEQGAAADAAAESGRDEKHLHTVSELYIQQVMLFSGADPFRVMGAEPGAGRADLRKHLRLLMTWLHPDKNASEWRSVFASRVLEAWQTVSAADRTDADSEPVHAPIVYEPELRPFSNPAPWSPRKAHGIPMQPRPRRRRPPARRRSPVFQWLRKLSRRSMIALVALAVILPGALYLAT
jgi:hypothetical protein